MRTLWFGAVVATCCLVPPLRADEAKKPEAKTVQVPYRLTNAKHVMVRAKINGKGPYNFLVDTGAPALFVNTAVCRKLGIEPDKKGWGTFERFEIEGGVVIAKAKGRIEDPFQLKGMNAMGLAGAELHGIIGYQVLAKFRLEFDFTRDKMAWTPLAFEPPPPQALGGKGMPAELDALGSLMEFMGKFLGKPPGPELALRGFLGIELSDDAKGIVVKSVLDKGPASMAGLKTGDSITAYQGRTVRASEDLHKLAADLLSGESVKLTVVRGAETHQITVKAGEGL